MKYNNSEIFKIETNHKFPSRGKILISEPFLCDETFGRSVILLIDHTEEGSMGLIINKPLKFFLNDVISEFKYLNDIPLYYGGPLGGDRLFFIHSIPDIAGSIAIGKNLYFNGDFTEIKKYILQGNPIDNKIRFYLGYSGWETGQLDQEIEENTWLISKSSHSILLEQKYSHIWETALINLGHKYKVWARFPQVPSMN